MLCGCLAHGSFFHTDCFCGHTPLRSELAESQEPSVMNKQNVQIWDQFTLKKEDNKVQRVYCKAELVYHNSSSTMIQHLNRKHPVNSTVNIDVSLFNVAYHH